MENILLESGKRLKEVRQIINEGGKLSVSQFAFILDESSEKIRNYELGRTQISIVLLSKLYERGVNPTYIITGNESFFANNDEGEKLKANISKHQKMIDSKIISKINRIEDEVKEKIINISK